MRFIRYLIPVLAALLVMLALACKSGGGSDQGDDQSQQQDSADYGDSGGNEFVSADPTDVLAESAEYFEKDVDSLQADLTFSMNANGLNLDATAKMAYQAPDQMYMTMDMGMLGTFEILMLGQDIYMNIPGMGWVSLSLADAGLEGLGLDPAELEQLVGEHSLVDYQALVDSLGGEITDLGEETLDGATYRHFRGEMDFADVAAALSDTFGASGDLAMSEISGPLTFDVWVDPDSSLPYKLEANGELSFAGEPMVFDATMEFTGYNEAVEIPAAPADAVPFAEMFSGELQ